MNAASNTITHNPDAQAECARWGPGRCVLIAGGGIGGLTLALALAKRGIASHVFEHKSEFGEAGAGIQIGPNGTRLLIALGLKEFLTRSAGTPASLVVRSGLDGTSLAELPLGAGNNPHHKAPYWTIHRADLHAALRDAVHKQPLILISMAKRVLHATSTDGNVIVTLNDGRKIEGDVLVAADGIHSTLRKAMLATNALKPYGKSAARTVIPADEFPSDVSAQKIGLWLAPNAHVVHYPVRRGEEIALVAIFDDADAREGWNTEIEADWVASKTDALAPELKRILAAGTSWRKWSLYQAPNLKCWTDRRIALLGDAAHPVLPFLAQGGVLAIEDAFVLADCLQRQPDNVVTALYTYQTMRKPRAVRVVRASAWNGKFYHLAGVSAAIRDGVMRCIGGRILINQYDWLYGWQPSTCAKIPAATKPGP